MRQYQEMANFNFSKTVNKVSSEFSHIRTSNLMTNNHHIAIVTQRPLRDVERRGEEYRDWTYILRITAVFLLYDPWSVVCIVECW